MPIGLLLTTWRCFKTCILGVQCSQQVKVYWRGWEVIFVAVVGYLVISKRRQMVEYVLITWLSNYRPFHLSSSLPCPVPFIISPELINNKVHLIFNLLLVHKSCCLWDVYSHSLTGVNIRGVGGDRMCVVWIGGFCESSVAFVWLSKRWSTTQPVVLTTVHQT